jgi:hypothetical protein
MSRRRTRRRSGRCLPAEGPSSTETSSWSGCGELARPPARERSRRRNALSSTRRRLIPASLCCATSRWRRRDSEGRPCRRRSGVPGAARAPGDTVREGVFAASHQDGRETRWHSSTSPALNASAARAAPPTMRSLLAASFSWRIASGSNSRSIRVLAVDTASSVLETRSSRPTARSPRSPA